MTEKTAQRIADVALGTVALGAAYYILRTPPLRRLAVGLAMTALTGGMPALLAKVTGVAMEKSGQRAI